MQHCAATLRTKRGRHRVREVSLDPEITGPALRDGAGFTLARTIERKVDFGQYLDRLDQETRVIVELLRQDISVPEICRITRRSRSDVYRTIRRELKKSFESRL